MRKFNYASSILAAVFIPLMILILSSNIVLRISETYVYHFNDSRATAGLAYNVTGSEFADEIAGYWSSFGGEFQVYDDNGRFRDPIFDDKETEAMRNDKSVLVVLLGSPFYKTFIIFSSVLGLALLGIFIYIHYNLTKAKRIFY